MIPDLYDKRPKPLNELKDILKDSCPRILCLLDKNPYSPTYGSFDRKYWQYKIIDFPCGMQQELILPLAYLWKNRFPGNKYHNVPRIEEYLKGIFLFHGKCCHADGSMDDYFPYERAFGATAYALAATTEAAIMTGICPQSAIEALEKSGRFLAKYREAGLLSNHLAIAATALINLYELTGRDSWKVASEGLVEELQKLLHPEGWFPEYGGCDLGYQTVTVEFLARYYRKSPSDRLLDVLKKSCCFLHEFIHPDGSLGGEYGSRNTYNFYPGGFALLSALIPEAGEIYSLFRLGMRNGKANCLEDDGVFGHMLSSYVTALSAGVVRPDGQEESERNRDERLAFFPKAGLYSITSGYYRIVGNTTKGGVHKIFKEGELVSSDTGYVGRLANGTIFCQNNARSSEGRIQDNCVEITGEFKKYSGKRLKMFEMAGLRILSLLFGRVPGYSNAVRRVMQFMLIYKRADTGIRFMRRISFGKDGITVEDRIEPAGSSRIVELFRSTDCVNMHVITSDSFQYANLLSWERMPLGVPEENLQFIRKY